MASTNNDGYKVYDIGIEKELRFVVGEGRTASIELLSGFAEIFGAELVQNTVYAFQQYSSISVYTWRGCSLKLSGNVMAYVASDSLIMISVNIHACLEEMRIIAEKNKTKGPICLVVGPMQSGKSSFSRFLLNYAVRLGRKPLYIDLDVMQNQSSMPGSINVLPIEKQFHITEEFHQKAMSVFLFGYWHPKENTSLYFLLIKKLGDMLQKRLDDVNPNIRHSGTIIEACGWSRGPGYTAITLAAYAFEIDVVFVIKDEVLFSKLKKHMPWKVKKVFIPQQNGIVECKKSIRKNIRDNLIWEYFYGSVRKPMTPYKFDVNFSDIQIYCVDCNTLYTKPYINPYTISVKDIKVISVEIGLELVNSILGMSFANTLDENLLVTNVKGFICIAGVDMNKKVITVLSPQPGPLPSNILILCWVKLKRKDV